MVSMHAFWGLAFLGFCTGQTFGDNASPANFNIAAVVRREHAKFLWTNNHKRCMEEAKEYLRKITFDAQQTDPRPFQQAARDKYNNGVLNDNGSRKAAMYTNHVDNNLYANVEETMLRTIACSIVAVNKIFGGSHEFLTKILLSGKFDPILLEQRTLLGHYPDTCLMMVKLSPRQQEKILHFLKNKEWISTRKTATLRELAQVIGIVQSVAEFYPWAIAQL